MIFIHASKFRDENFCFKRWTFEDLKNELKAPRFGLAAMKHLLLTTIAAVLVVGCGELPKKREIINYFSFALVGI
jgi:hypothetical protein